MKYLNGKLLALFLVCAWAVIGAVTLQGCTQRPATADETQNAQQEKLSAAAVAAVGMPDITNNAEKRMMKEILEERDKMHRTWTYMRDMQGRFHFVCDSVGYGLPSATQYTSPAKIDRNYGSAGGNVVTPQADPNGLYSPAATDATWVLCLNPKTKKAEAQYFEDKVNTFTYERTDAIIDK